MADMLKLITDAQSRYRFRVVARERTKNPVPKVFDDQPAVAARILNVPRKPVRATFASRSRIFVCTGGSL